MNVDFWHNQWFTDKRIPDWHCPTCSKGLLTIKKEEFKFEEDSESEKAHKHDDFDHTWVSYRFTGMLRCNNDKCRDVVAFIGKGNVEEDGDPFGVNYIHTFLPTYFEPALHLFSIHPKCSKEIRKQIIKAFSLYWADVSASANQIRVALEMLMDEWKVKKTFIDDKGVRQHSPLHFRIESFAKKYKKKYLSLKNHLIAIKWIGNYGSHSKKALTNYEVLQGFDLLHHCIDKIYDDREKELSKISKRIINNNKKRKKKKPIA